MTVDGRAQIFIYVLQPFKSESNEFVEADAFVRPVYSPRNEGTKERVDAILEKLNLPKKPKYRMAVSSVIVASRAAKKKGSNRIAVPGDSNDYVGAAYGYRIAVIVRDTLIEHGHLKRVSRQARDQSVVFETTGLDVAGSFQSSEPWHVRAREKKPPGASKGYTLSRKQCVGRFRQAYLDAEHRMQRLNETYSAHPLVSSDGTAWGGAYRIFNDGRLDRGGRLYGDWQQLKEEDRLKLKIDGEPLAEIDITACFLFILSAKAGTPIIDKDPYQAIPWVKDKQKRDLAKKLIAAIISTDGPLGQFPQGVRKEYSIPKKTKISELQEPILATFPQLRTPLISGMEAMYEESEAVLAAIEELMKRAIVTYPVHDCLLVPEKDWETTVEVLQAEMVRRFGSSPWLTVTLPNGSVKNLAPPGRAT